MLYQFVVANREAIIERTRLRARVDDSAFSADSRLEYGVPKFLTQLTEALEAHAFATAQSVADRAAVTKLIGSSAARHGEDLLKSGFTLAEVVHGYGAVCQVVTELAMELNRTIGTEEFQIFNLCLDDAIAGAVTAYGEQREHDLAYLGTERLGVYAHEVRNFLNTAILSLDAIRRGQVGFGGSTGAILSRSLVGLRNLTERSLSEVRLGAGVPRPERILVNNLLEELELDARLQAHGLGLQLAVLSVPADVAIDADRQLLISAVSNLLQNAFKFTPHGTVVLSARVNAERVVIEVADECGGLPPGRAEELFNPFTQKGDDKSGLGLGLTIALRAVQSCGAQLSVRDLPGHGCVFTIDLAKCAPSPSEVQPLNHAPVSL